MDSELKKKGRIRFRRKQTTYENPSRWEIICGNSAAISVEAGRLMNRDAVRRGRAVEILGKKKKPPGGVFRDGEGLKCSTSNVAD